MLLSFEKPTEKAIPYDCYPDGKPEIDWDSDEVRILYGEA
jgi:hypothetical protein